MIKPEHDLPVVRQCELLGLARSTAYYCPEPTSEADLVLMRRIDELHLKWPFLGARRLRDLLNTEGFAVGRKHVGTLHEQDGHRNPVPQTQNQYARFGSDAPSVPVPFAQTGHRSAQSSLGDRHHVYPDGQRVLVSGGDHGLGEPSGSRLAHLEHAHHGFLRGGARGGDGEVRNARDL